MQIEANVNFREEVVGRFNKAFRALKENLFFSNNKNAYNVIGINTNKLIV